MNKSVFLASLFLFTFYAQANVVLTDSFTYENGPLVGAAGSQWDAHSGAGSSPVLVTNGAIRVSFSGVEDVNRLLSGGPYTVAGGGALYSSFKAQFSVLPNAGGGYFAHFKDTNSGAATGFGARIYASTTGAASNQFRLAIGNGTSATSTGAQFPLDLSTGVVYTVVTRFRLDTGTATLWINPTSESDAGITGTDEGTPTRPNPIDVVAYAFRQGAGIGTMLIDELKVGTSFTDVAGPNNPPSITGISDQNVSANTTIGPLGFTIGDLETPTGSLTLTKSSSDNALVPENNIVFGGTGSNRTVTITPNINAQGLSTITLTVSDGTSQASISFLVSVGLPSISNVPDQQTTINTPTPSIPVLISDAETAAASLILSASSSNQGIVPDANIVFGGTGTNRTVTVTPGQDVTGLATITLTVSDGETVKTETFVVTVAPVIGLLRSDDFNRPDGPLVYGTTLWFSHSGTLGDATNIQGQLRLSGAQTEDVSTDLTTSGFDTAGGYILYSSFTVNVSQLPTLSGTYFAHFKGLASDFRGRIYIGTANAAPGKYRLGIANNAASVSEQWPVDLEPGNTYHVVSRYNVGTGASTLWVDPDSEASPSANATDLPSPIPIWYYAFRQSGGIGTLFVDDLKVGGSFSSVYAPKPRLAIVRNGNNVEVSWPASATGYTLQSTTDFVSWGNASNQGTVVGDRKVASFISPSGSQFFRLVQ